MHRTFIRVGLICFTVLLLMVGCSDSPTDSERDPPKNTSSHDPDLIGIWECTNYLFNGEHDGEGGLFGWENTFWHFKADGTMTETDTDPGEEAYTEQFTWSTSGSSITMEDESGISQTGSYSIQGSTVVFSYSVSGNTMVITMVKQ